MALCPNCGGENPNRAKFCLECGTPLFVARQMPKQARKTVTVVFSDVAGSTSLMEQLDPESMRAVMNSYFDEMRAILERHGGTVEKFIGDAVMAVFGIPTTREDDALRAVKAAMEIRTSLGKLSEQVRSQLGVALDFRTGVNTGEVIAGDASHGQAFATGDAVNVAARLEQKASPGEILIGNDTYQLVRDAVAADSVEPLALKGKSEPVPAWRLSHLLGRAGVARRIDSPLVGRDRELRLLRHAFDQIILERSCRLITVLGNAGVGKSRIAMEFVTSLGMGARVLRGRCLSYGEAMTFWPVAEVVKEAAGVGENDSAPQARAKIAGLLSLEDTETAIISERIESLLGITESNASMQESFWAVRRLFECLAKQCPTVVVFDDVHWAEPTFLDLIEYVVEFSRDSPLLFLCLARPELLELRGPLGGASNRTMSISLAPLEEAESELLIKNLLGAAELSADIRNRIWQAAQGNPLFVEEILRMLVDDGLLVRSEDRWLAPGDLSKVSVPPTINALLAARLDRLSALERDILQRGAVVGEVFWWGSVAEMSGEDAKDPVGSYLQALVRKELIRPDEVSFSGEDAFRFTHILVRDAAYNAMPKATRAELHQRFASWLEAKAGERASEYDEILGYHLEQAFNYREELGPLTKEAEGLATQAGQRLAAAGRRAFARGDMSSTVRLLQRAISLFRSEKHARVSLLPDLAVALFEVGDTEKSNQVLVDAIEQAKALEDHGIEWRATVLSSWFQMYTDPGGRNLTHVLPEVEALSKAFTELGDDMGLALTWTHLVDLRWMMGEAAKGVQAAELAVKHARLAPSRRMEANALSFLSWTMLIGPTPVSDARRRSLDLLREAGIDPMMRASMLAWLATQEAMLGNFTEARGYMAEGKALYEDLGLKATAAQALLLRGYVELLADDAVDAERHFREALSLFMEVGDQWFASTAAVDLPRAVYSQGRYEEAFLLTQNFDDNPAPYDLEWQIKRRQIMAKTLSQRGQWQSGKNLADEAVDLSRRTDFLNIRGDALVDLADICRLGDDLPSAVSALEEAIRLYARKGNVVSAAKARKLLEEVISTASAGPS